METLKVLSPYDGSLIKELFLSSDEDVEMALTKSYSLFQDRSRWLPPYERIAILDRVQKLMESQLEELTRIASQEGGKPYMDSRVEVLRAINGVQLAIENVGQIKGEEIPMGMTPASAQRLAFTMKEPIGVVLSISAFNHPLNLAVHQVIPAIAVGAPVIIKPASNTPLSAMKLASLLYDAGLPQDWCQVVICNRSNTMKMVSDKRVNYLSFIGSADVGWSLRSKLAFGTRCALEHGGSAPVIVEPDANLDSAVDMLVKGGFYHAGQVCVSVQRVYVHESIVDSFSSALASGASKLIVGDPLDSATQVGPLIDHAEVERVDKWVKEAVDNGAKLLTGGKAISKSCYQPTVLLNPPDDVMVSRREVFGPVVCVYSYTKREEAMQRANSLPLAFQAAVFTSNLEVALDTVKKLNASAVMVNDHTAFRVDWMPFGGRDASGIGMGGIPYSMREMTREKLMVIKSKVL